MRAACKPVAAADQCLISPQQPMGSEHTPIIPLRSITLLPTLHPCLTPGPAPTSLIHSVEVVGLGHTLTMAVTQNESISAVQQQPCSRSCVDGLRLSLPALPTGRGGGGAPKTHKCRPWGANKSWPQITQIPHCTPILWLSRHCFKQSQIVNHVPNQYDPLRPWGLDKAQGKTSTDPTPVWVAPPPSSSWSPPLPY